MHVLFKAFFLCSRERVALRKQMFKSLFHMSKINGTYLFILSKINISR